MNDASESNSNKPTGHTSNDSDMTAKPPEPSLPPSPMDSETSKKEPIPQEGPPSSLNLARLKREAKKASERRTYLQPKPGFEWNPLRSLPRNLPCPCQSGKKYKACHLDKMPLVVPVAVANDYREQIAKPGLVFRTKENEHLFKGTKPDTAQGEEPCEPTEPTAKDAGGT